MTSRAAIGFWVTGALATAAATYGVVRLAARDRGDPTRCEPGLIAMRARCCAPGQITLHAKCVGKPASCPLGMHRALSGTGCVGDPRRVDFAGGLMTLGNEDWQAEGIVTPRAVQVAAFGIDALEVTVERWTHCVRAGMCRELSEPEPGLPVSLVDPKEAERFCRFEKGRLPTGDEWLFAAAGTDDRRYPWGATGLVCRRAAFGAVDGPCAHGGGADLVGTHPDGATPEGVFDLAGNLAEWTLEPNGGYLARGGSYRSTSALELKSWASEVSPPRSRHVGFRCAYDPPPKAATLR